MGSAVLERQETESGCRCGEFDDMPPLVYFDVVVHGAVGFGLR